MEDVQALREMAAIVSRGFDNARETEREFGKAQSGARLAKANIMQKEFERHVDEVERGTNNSDIILIMVATYFDKTNIRYLIKEAIALETVNKTGFYYLNKKRTQSIFKQSGYQLPSALKNSSSNIIIRKIDGNLKISDITQSQQ